MPSPVEDLNKNKPVIVPKRCDNRDCQVSSDMDGNPTFGSGELNDYGYWSNPCEECARYHEAKFPGEKAWPDKV